MHTGRIADSRARDDSRGLLTETGEIPGGNGAFRGERRFRRVVFLVNFDFQLLRVNNTQDNAVFIVESDFVLVHDGQSLGCKT